MSEQDIITRYFSRHQSADNVDINIGDDAAVVIPPVNSRLVITTDTLNEGVHFFSDCPPEFVGHKALAVNLSDLAAMGAHPLWATINLSIQKVDNMWLNDFSNGLFALADEYDIKIIGGDLVKGPLSISIQAIGCVPIDKVLTRSNAKIDDYIYVTGTIGDAALGLKLYKESINLHLSKSKLEKTMQHFNAPNPMLKVGSKILDFASAAIDVSDGLLKDLQRITIMSKVGANIDFGKIPISTAVHSYIEKYQDWMLPLHGGDDYELIFTANEKFVSDVERISTETGCHITNIGKIVQDSGISLYKDNNKVTLPEHLGFDHYE